MGQCGGPPRGPLSGPSLWQSYTLQFNLSLKSPLPRVLFELLSSLTWSLSLPNLVPPDISDAFWKRPVAHMGEPEE